VLDWLKIDDECQTLELSRQELDALVIVTCRDLGLFCSSLIPSILTPSPSQSSLFGSTIVSPFSVPESEEDLFADESLEVHELVNRSPITPEIRRMKTSDSLNVLLESNVRYNLVNKQLFKSTRSQLFKGGKTLNLKKSSKK